MDITGLLLKLHSFEQTLKFLVDTVSKQSDEIKDLRKVLADNNLLNEDQTYLDSIGDTFTTQFHNDVNHNQKTSRDIVKNIRENPILSSFAPQVQQMQIASSRVRQDKQAVQIASSRKQQNHVPKQQSNRNHQNSSQASAIPQSTNQDSMYPQSTNKSSTLSSSRISAFNQQPMLNNPPCSSHQSLNEECQQQSSSLNVIHPVTLRPPSLILPSDCSEQNYLKKQKTARPMSCHQGFKITSHHAFSSNRTKTIDNTRVQSTFVDRVVINETSPQTQTSPTTVHELQNRPYGNSNPFNRNLSSLNHRNPTARIFTDDGLPMNSLFDEQVNSKIRSQNLIEVLTCCCPCFSMC